MIYIYIYIFLWHFVFQVPFFTLPPEDDAGGGVEGAKAAEAVFVEGFGKDFDVEAGDAEVGILFFLSAGFFSVDNSSKHALLRAFTTKREKHEQLTPK